uniref:Uncharacterized protein n=1 Tax=Noccaea caerulescens TaxID=107243 RepID=A0A1J3D8B3_NOCCA
MALSLPEPCLDILYITISSLKIDLIEWHMNIHSANVSFTFPESFESGMEVLSDCVRTGIPKSNPFDEVERNGIVAEGRGKFEAADHVGEVNGSVTDIVDAGDIWNI